MREEMQKNANDITEILQEAIKEIPEIFKNKVDNIDTDDIREVLEDFRDKEAKEIKDVMSDTVNIIESSIYIGFLGRYSHGKTALINSLFSIDDAYLLPEGEGQVTSKVTRIEFNNSLTFPKCFEVDKKDKRTNINFTFLRNSVGKTLENKDNSTIAYYLMQLVSSSKFGKTFEENKIALIDLPGLGGKYFKDTINTKRYVQNIDMLIVVINITDIENSAKTIEPYIRDLHIPIIPVFTFFDKWKDSDVFAKCSNDEEALSLAKEIVKEKINSLDKYQTRIIATSAKTNFQIDTLRAMILTFVDVDNIAIEKIIRKDPIVFKQKISEISRAINNVMNKTNTALINLDKKINTILPETNNLQTFSEYSAKKWNKGLKKIKKEIIYGLKDVFKSSNNNINDIRNLIDTKTISDKVKSIERDFNKLIKDINTNFQNEYLSLKNSFIDLIDNYMNKLHLDNSSKNDIKEELKMIVDDNDIDFYGIDYQAPEIQTIIAKETAKTFADKIKNNIFNLKFILPFVIGLSLTTMKPLFGIGASWATKIGMFLFFGSFIVVIYDYFTDESARKNNFSNAKNDIINKIKASIDLQEYKNKYITIIDKTASELINEIDKYLKEETYPYKKDLKIVSKISKELRELLEKVNKQLARKV